MSSNHKLTGVIRGRTITGTQQQDGKLQVHFNDGSIMTVKTSGPVSSGAAGATVTAVRQQGTTLSLDMENRPTWTIPTAEATSSVMVRDKNHTLEYAD